MKKRILSLLLVVAMLATMIVMPAYAAAPNAADYNNTPDTCPCGCGKAWSEITWTDMPAGTNITSSYFASTSGHYRLTGDRTYGRNASGAFRVNSADVVAVFDFNGYTISATGTLGSERIFNIEKSTSTLHIVDTSANSTGKAISSVSGGYPVYNSGKLEIHGGHFSITKTTTSKGGIIYNAGAAMHIKGGVFDASKYDKSTGQGGAIYSTNAFTVENAYVIGGNAGAGGDAIYAYNTNMTIKGSTVVEGEVMNSATSCKTELKDTITLTELDLTAGAALTYDKIVALAPGASINVKAASNTPFATGFSSPEQAANYAKYFKSGVAGLKVKIDADSNLVLSAPSAVEGVVCPHCGGEKTWQPWTAATGDVTTGGHYYLDDSVEINNEYSIKANICLDLNGKDITGTNSGKTLFRVGSGCTLNICDVSDSGESTLSGKNNGDGGCFIINGNLNIKGGSNGIELKSTAPTPGSGTPSGQGGIFRVSGNSSIVSVEGCTVSSSPNYAYKNGGVLHNGGSGAQITFTDCTLTGGHVSGNGGVISTATGTITLNNCTVNGSQAGGYGGAIAFTANGKLNLNNSTVVDGTAAAIDGFSTAGIYHATYGGNTIEASTVGTIYTVNNGAWVTLIGTVNIGNLILDNDTQSTINLKTNTERMSTDSYVGLTVTADKFGGYGKVSTAGEDAAAKLACFDLKTSGLVMVARDLDILVAYPGVAAVDAAGKKTWKATADEALALNPEYLLLGAISAVEVNTDAVIDINGNNTVISGEAEVTLFDSANTNELSFGEVTLVDVTLANPVEYTAPNGFRYCTVAGDNNTYSFHVLNLEVSAIGLKTSGNGMYYYANFAFDSALQNAVAYYGIEYSLYDKNGVDKIVDKTQAVAIDSNTLALETYKDIPIGAMNGIIGSDINGYSDSECGQMKIEAKPFIIIDGQVIYGEAVKYSMYDCCAAVDAMITELNAGTAAQKEEAAMYTGYMENLFDVVWAEYVLGWNFTNFNKDA